MGSENSSNETRERARRVAAEIGAIHTDMCIDSAVSAIVSLFTIVTGAYNSCTFWGVSPLFAGSHPHQSFLAEQRLLGEIV
jgi:hypothetical protein